MAVSRWILLVSAGFFIFSISRGVSRWVTGSRGPRAEITPTDIDLGVVNIGDIIQRAFLVRNAGDARLLVTDIKTTCQCTVAKLDSRAVDPGKSVRLNVTFGAKSSGLTNQKIVVQTNEVDRPMHVLQMHAQAVPARQP